MPVEVTANYIRIRVANPKQFIRFRIKILGKGIKAVIGFRKGGGSQIQSLLFPKSRYNMKQARAWVKSHGHSVSETFHVTKLVISETELKFRETPLTDEEIAKLEKEEKTEPWDWLVRLYENERKSEE